MDMREGKGLWNAMFMKRAFTLVALGMVLFVLLFCLDFILRQESDGLIEQASRVLSRTPGGPTETAATNTGACNEENGTKWWKRNPAPLQQSSPSKQPYFLRTPVRWNESEGVTVLMWEKMRSTGGIKLTNLYPNNGGANDLNPAGRPLRCPDRIIDECPVKCRWTYRRELLSRSHVVISHPDESSNFPPSKYAAQMWAVFGHEPTWKRPFWKHSENFENFDVSYHWGTNADVQLRFFYFDQIYYGEDPGQWWTKINAEELWGSKIAGGAALKTALDVAGVLKNSEEFEERVIHPDDVVLTALVSVVVGNCNPVRRKWLFQFMSQIPTASYGTCLKNAQGDGRKIQHGSNSTRDLMEQKLELIKQHPFYLAIESDLEAGFITEKVFQGLMAGTIPIYEGHRDVLQMVPPNSIIFAPDFDNVTHLVDHILEVAGDYDKFMKYHEWRKDPNTLKVFEKLKNEGRITAACRLCQFYAQHREDPLLWETRLRWDAQVGWSRGLNSVQNAKTLTLPARWMLTANEWEKNFTSGVSRRVEANANYTRERKAMLRSELQKLEAFNDTLLLQLAKDSTMDAVYFGGPARKDLDSFRSGSRGGGIRDLECQEGGGSGGGVTAETGQSKRQDKDEGEPKRTRTRTEEGK